jgi:hypothetical protein
MKVFGLGLLLASMIATPAMHAQKIAGAQSVGHGTVRITAEDYKKLTAKYFRGDAAGLREDLAKLFATATFLDFGGDPMKEPPHRFDFGAKFYSVIFTAKNPAAKDPELVRVLIIPSDFAKYYDRSGSTGAQLGTATLPGVKKLYDVFLTNDEDATAGTTYTYTEVENPLHAQFLAAAKLVDFGAIAESLRIARARHAADPGAVPEDVAPPPAVAYFALTEITIPVSRANLTAKTATDSGDIAQSKIHEASDDALNDAEIRHALVSRCAVAIARAAARAVDDSIDESSAATLDDRDNLKANVRKAIRDTQGGGVCDAEVARAVPATASLRFDAIRAVQDVFVGIAEGPDGKRMENETVYANAPLNRLSLGVIAAGIFNATGDARVKMDDGKVVADPLSGAMSVATLYIHPQPFLSNTVEPSVAERLRFLVGYVATSEPGLAVGTGVLLFRGLTFNAGYAAMLVDERASGVELGKEPTVDNPFKRGVGRTFFAGFGYAF